MKNSNGFLLVFSQDMKSSFVELTPLKEQILRVKDQESVPMVLAANKCDLPAETREVSEDQIVALSKQWHVPYYLTSAKTGQNINEVFHNLISQIRGINPDKKEKKSK